MNLIDTLIGDHGVIDSFYYRYAFSLQFVTHSGTAMNIYCGQTTAGNTNGNETIYLQFTNEEEQNVIIVDRYDSFMPSVTIKDAEGRYIDNGFTTDCNGEDCDGNAVMVKALSPGMYTAEMTTSGDGGEFKVDMMCSGKPLDGEGTVSVYYDSYCISSMMSINILCSL